MTSGKRSGYKLIAIPRGRQMETIFRYTTKTTLTAPPGDEDAMTRIRALLAVVAVALLAACSQSPTAVALEPAEEAARGGSSTIGSGL